jgi:hypothetical protein
VRCDRGWAAYLRREARLTTAAAPAASKSTIPMITISQITAAARRGDLRP